MNRSIRSQRRKCILTDVAGSWERYCREIGAGVSLRCYPTRKRSSLDIKLPRKLRNLSGRTCKSSTVELLRAKQRERSRLIDVPSTGGGPSFGPMTSVDAKRIADNHRELRWIANAGCTDLGALPCNDFRRKAIVGLVEGRASDGSALFRPAFCPQAPHSRSGPKALLSRQRELQNNMPLIVVRDFPIGVRNRSSSLRHSRPYRPICKRHSRAA